LFSLTLLVTASFVGFTARQQTELIHSNISRLGTALIDNLVLDASNRLLSLDYDGLEVLLLQYAALPEVKRIRVFDHQNFLISDVRHYADEAEVSYNVFGETVPDDVLGLLQRDAIFLEGNQELSIWQPLIVGGNVIGYAGLDLSLAQISSVQRQLLLNTLSFGLILILSGLLFIFVYLRRPMAAIHNASQFALALDENLGKQMPIEHFSKEFQYLGESLNAVSQRLQLQAKRITKSENHLQSVLANAVDGIISLDENLRIVSFNQAAESLFEYKANDLVHKPVQVLFERDMTFLKQADRFSEKRTRLRAISSKGKSFTAELSKSYVDLEEGRLYVLIIRDITERLKQETALRQSEEESRKLSIVASQTGNAVVITDRHGLIEWVNESFTRVTEYSLQDVLGKKPGSFLQGPDSNPKTIANIRDAIKNQLSFKGEILNYSKSNRPYWLELEIPPVFSRSGELTNFIAIESDVTERKKSSEVLQMALADAETANKAKSEFLSRMSHELRTPLNAILGFGQLLMTDDLTEFQIDSAQHIFKAGKHLLQLIDEILDISRIEAGSMNLANSSVSLIEVLHDSFAMVSGLAREKQVTFEFKFEDEEYLIQSDVQRLKQVFINLFSNAIKYNKAEGRVFVSCLSLEDGNVQCMVKDTGLGIAEDKMSRLFVPFDRLGAERTTVEGTGIGLALTKSLVEAMGASLTVQSKVNEGTQFILKFTKAKEAPSKELNTRVSQVLPKPVHSLNKRVDLIYIEDNESNIALLKQLFAEHEQFKLHVAMNATDGLKLSKILKPDLMLLDFNLPDLSGAEFLEIVKQDSELKAMPVIILSADATLERQAELRALGADDYVTKPIIIETLLESISNALESRVRA